MRPGAATVVLAELGNDQRWPAGDDIEQWQALTTKASEALRSLQRNGATDTEIHDVTTWAQRRQLKIRRLARSVRATVNEVATHHGLMDRPRGLPCADMVAALQLAGCDPRMQLAAYLDELVHVIDDPGVRQELAEMRRGLRLD